ncbi:MAG TPA: stage II sporulation protein P [Clostridiales bacterium]|nr:stage II sporulation protein P [Clostridiales bacterium]HCW52092.1 stage II sporulation protein P [Clostridiales bacterium]
MSDRRRSIWVGVAVSVALLLLSLSAAWSLGGRPPESLSRLLTWILARPGTERVSGYYTLVDEAGNILLETARVVAPGDLFIDPAGVWHRVTRVTRDTAETVTVPPGVSLPQGFSSLAGSRVWAGAALSRGRALRPAHDLAVPLGTARQVIVIYHTHSDESYVPTDGVSSIPGNGGIYDVGEALSAGLTTAGFTVVHDRTAHDPHDAGAYPRSRRTVLRNLRFGPTLLFDVHRDAAPPAAYLTTIDGVHTARVLIVVGGANPMVSANLGTARRLKAVAEDLYPGLTRGILVARGNYNQDLDPGAILLEMGTELIPKEAAVRAAGLWANVVAASLGPPAPDTTPPGAGER